MKVNGKELSLKKQEMNLQELLDNLRVNKEKVVVELDGVIITKEDFFTTKLKESNIIEVISFVGGG
jgi:sulfur carrier protein